MSWENLFQDQSIFQEVITLYILTTFSLDYVLISLGENRFSSLSGLKGLTEKDQAPVVQMLDSTIQLIKHYPVDKYWVNQ